MNCLHCGDCCLSMSPISAPAPCPKIKQDGDFYFCSDYQNMPEECAKHDFPSRFCPIGMDKLHTQIVHALIIYGLGVFLGYCLLMVLANKPEQVKDTVKVEVVK